MLTHNRIETCYTRYNMRKNEAGRPLTLRCAAYGVEHTFTSFEDASKFFNVHDLYHQQVYHAERALERIVETDDKQRRNAIWVGYLVWLKKANQTNARYKEYTGKDLVANASTYCQKFHAELAACLQQDKGELSEQTIAAVDNHVDFYSPTPISLGLFITYKNYKKNGDKAALLKACVDFVNADSSQPLLDKLPDFVQF